MGVPSPGADIVSHMDPETAVSSQQLHWLNAPERQAHGQFIKEASVLNGVVCSS